MISRNEGMTSIYNRFHNPEEVDGDIVELRELHAQMDKVVAGSYRWNDLDLKHSFYETKQGVRYTISESAAREVLKRILNLNHKIYQQENISDGKSTKSRSTKKATDKSTYTF